MGPCINMGLWACVLLVTHLLFWPGVCQANGTTPLETDRSLTSQDTGIVFWTPGKSKHCWNDCGGKGDFCPEVCAENGWCCRKDFAEDNCPDKAREVSTSGYHSCVLKQGFVHANTFEDCVDKWCLQDGTSEQYTRCEEARDGGHTCVNPQIRYGKTEGGIPHKHDNNDYNAWCKMIFREELHGSVSLGSRDCSAPNGKLLWCSGGDNSDWKWCDWRDSKWKDDTLDDHSGCSSAITYLSCKKKRCKVDIGPSSYNTISTTVTLGCKCPAKINKSNWLGGFSYGDEFEVTQNGSSVVVKRTDNGGGWDMDLSFICAVSGCKAHIGPSSDNKISATVTVGCKCPVKINKSNWLGGFSYGDEFEVTQDGSSLVVKRTDDGGGWDMDLSFMCPENTCMTDNGACIFPFTYKGSTYSGCTKDNRNQAWCATKLDQTGNWWGNCPSTCQMHIPGPAVVYKYTRAYDNICKFVVRGNNGIVAYNGAIWQPKNYQSDFCLLGDVATNGHNAPLQPAIAVSAKKSGAVVHPSSFTRVWKDHWRISNWDCAVYRMSAPVGYTCLGGVAMRSHTEQPDRNKYCCVKNDYIVPGKVEHVYDDKGHGSKTYLSLWTVLRGTDVYGLDGGNFVPVRGYAKPAYGNLLKGDDVTVKDGSNIGTESKPLTLYEVSDLKQIWNDKGSHADSDVAIWRTETKDDYYSVGDIAVNSYRKPIIGFLLKASKDHSDAIQKPASYSKIWNDSGSGAKLDVTIWRANCPGGYVALGNVATDGVNPMYVDSWTIACVKSRYVETGSNNGNSWQLIWKDHGSGAKKDVSIYETKSDMQTQQTVRGMGAIASHNGYPGIPYLLKKSEVTYNSEKPIVRIEMTSVKYNLKAEKKHLTSPVKLYSLPSINYSSFVKPESSIAVKYETSVSKEFTFQQSIAAGVELKCMAGIPLIGGTETTISVALTSTFIIGKVNTTTTSMTGTGSVEIPPYSKITISVVGKQYTADIPFTAHVKKIYYDNTEGNEVITGIYHGSTITEAQLTYSEAEKLTQEEIDEHNAIELKKSKETERMLQKNIK